MLLHLDATLVIVAISFIIFTLLMNKFFIVPLINVMEERNSYIKNNEAIAQEKLDKSEELTEDYDNKILQAKMEANKVISEKTGVAKSQKNELIARVSDKNSEELSSLRKELDLQKEKAIQDLKPDITILAQSVVNKIVSGDLVIPDSYSEKVLNSSTNR